MLSSLLHTDVVVEEMRDIPALDPLHPAEASSLGRVVGKRGREFAAGRSCARRAVARLGVAPRPILIGPDREPLWPDGVVGSITHCAGYCAAAVARRTRLAAIGVDAEPNRRLPPGVLDMVAGADEKAALALLPDTGVWWDTALFSAKESVFKAWFPLTRQWLGFRDATVLFDAATASFSARLLVPTTVNTRCDVAGFEGRLTARDGVICTAVQLRSGPFRPRHDGTR